MTQRIEELYRSGDLSALIKAIERSPLPAYFGLQTDLFQEMLESVAEAGLDTRGTARSFLDLLFPGRNSDQRKLALPAWREVSTSAALEPLHLIGRMAALRLSGRAHETHHWLSKVDSRIDAVDPLFGDRSGWPIMIPLQAGITSMLAGDFKRALEYFVRAQVQPTVPALSFLTRDAFAKAALVHVLFGRVVDARSNLEKAAAIAPSGSWAEPLIDATAQLAEALANISDAQEAIELIDSIQLQSIGEMWPFYIIGLGRLLECGGNHRELLPRLKMLEGLPFPRADGEGVSGSVFAISRATVHLLSGDVFVAQSLLLEADPDYVATQAALIQLNLEMKQPQQAIKVAQLLAADKWRGLRQVELWRFAGLSAAYLQLGRENEAREALYAALQGGVTSENLALFAQEVLQFAENQVEGWPLRPPTDTPATLTQTESQMKLTGREFQVLRLLVEEKTRSQIADELFVSLNTLKSHLKVIYRKLGVTSREAAVLRAEAVGWL